MWLVYRWREVEPPYRPRWRAQNLDLYPSPTVSAGGMGAGNRQNYWLADEPAARGDRDLEPICGGRDLGQAALSDPAARGDPRAPVERPVGRVDVRRGGRLVDGLLGCQDLPSIMPSSSSAAVAHARRASTASGRHVALRQRRGLDAGELLDAAGLQVGELDVLDGSPPCEPFSTAGLRDKTWGEIREYSGERQRTDDLFFEFARLVDGIRPRCFAAENVTGLVKGRAKGQFKRIMARLRACGYVVAARVLDAAWLGVPQSRQRVIIVGVRTAVPPCRCPVFGGQARPLPCERP